ncbi:uncharacterized mitochondrial protein AtMg00810-like [Arachis duranensis]|uniref:Uncharacterized mitochondrial protein AtMg00810-like n=1 Tax=Arachis duranensis TaxID=130453 RepID=A0A6P4D7D2_ARADU|nr:uncharacterized mitochondrial protein AtMg00810-like [Arachis duranensis]
MDDTVLDNPTLYRQLVADLVYLTVTRLDIAYPIYLLSHFLSALRTTHYTVVLRILCYIKGILFHGLHFSVHSSLTLQRAKKQTFTARLSTKAKYRALADTTVEVVLIRWLFENLVDPQPSPTTVYCDNRGTIQIANNVFFMNAPNTLRLIVILSGNAFLLMLFIS